MCLEQLGKKLSPGAMTMWFNQARPLSLNESELVLGYPTGFMLEWVDCHFRREICRVLQDVTGKEMSLLLVELDEKEVPVPAAAPQISTEVVKAVAAETPAAFGNLNHSYSFDTFVVGETNRFAFNACIQAATAPGAVYNPLFIHGASGLGKTHLLQSIAREVRKRNPKARVEYISSEKFGNLYINACISKERDLMNKFRSRFRSVDVLLIDDVQFFGGKTAMQEEFFHTFNALNDGHKQIVLASDRTPLELPDLSERLVSRFAGGLTVDITPPDLDERIAILQSKQKDFENKFPDEILRYIATRIRSNVRNLESSLFTLQAYVVMEPGMLPCALSRAKVDEIIGSKFEADAAEQVSIPRIIDAVARYFEIKPQEIRGKSRKASISRARHIAMFLSRALTENSLTAIAETFNREHPTVIHALGSIEEQMNASEMLRQQVADLKRQLVS